MLKRIIISVLILMAMAGTAMADTYKPAVSSNNYKAHGTKYSSWMTATVICEGGYKYLVVTHNGSVAVTQMTEGIGESGERPIPCK